MVWVHTHGLLCHQCENGNGKLKLYQNVILLGLVYIYGYKIVYIIRYILCYFLFFSRFFYSFFQGLVQYYTLSFKVLLRIQCI